MYPYPKHVDSMYAYRRLITQPVDAMRHLVWGHLLLHRGPKPPVHWHCNVVRDALCRDNLAAVQVIYQILACIFQKTSVSRNKRRYDPKQTFS